MNEMCLLCNSSSVSKYDCQWVAQKWALAGVCWQHSLLQISVGGEGEERCIAVLWYIPQAQNESDFTNFFKGSSGFS